MSEKMKEVWILPECEEITISDKTMFTLGGGDDGSSIGPS